MTRLHADRRLPASFGTETCGCSAASIPRGIPAVQFRLTPLAYVAEPASGSGRLRFQDLALGGSTAEVVADATEDEEQRPRSPGECRCQEQREG